MTVSARGGSLVLVALGQQVKLIEVLNTLLNICSDDPKKVKDFTQKLANAYKLNKNTK